MKTILFLILLCGVSAQASEFTMSGIQGKYRLTSEKMPIVTILQIDSRGIINLQEEQGRFSCKGKSKIVSNVIDAEIQCKKFYENRKFQFGVNLSEVSDFNSFTAPLIFPMIGETIWHFEKIED